MASNVCSEYFNVFEYLAWTSHEIKKAGGTLVKPAPTKRKNYPQWNTSSGNKCLWRWQFQQAGAWKKKAILLWVREHINKNSAICKSLCNLQELHTACFQRKMPKCNHYLQEYFNWNITSSPYLEMLLISMIKLVFLFFLSDYNVWRFFL